MAGCATAPKRIEGVTRGVDSGALQHWDAAGRIGVAATQGGGSGSFTWQQRGMQSSVQLHGPVGVGSLQLQVSGDEIEVRAANGETYRADDAMNELQARLGAVIPPGKLRYWLIGRAAPGDYRWLDAGRSVLEQDGWHIEYSEYLAQDNLRLPAKIVASNGTTRVRILIERWRVG
jgi:outer membrane lipoprotein LolB